MKQLSLISLGWFLVLLASAGLQMSVHAQVVPNSSTRPAATPVAVPAAYLSSNTNFVRSWMPKIPISDVPTLTSASRTHAEVTQETQYFDGLGRKIQSVSKQQSPLGRDYVQAQVYDSLGRQKFLYMPFVPKDANNTDGLFKLNPFTSQKTFYQDTVLNPGMKGESVYYMQQVFEQSPLNRVLKTYPAGNSWALEGGNKPSEKKYVINSDNDSVRIWNVGTGYPTSPGFYPTRELTKLVSVDQSGKMMVTYADKENRVVLTKIQASATPGTAHMGWLCTYKVYDLFGNLVFEISPKGVEAIRANWVITATVANELCFQTRYDARQRAIVTKPPGADSIEQVFDKRNRVVMTREAILKSHFQWKAFYFDRLGRERMNGLFYSANTRVQMQALMDAAAFDPVNSIPVTVVSESSVIALLYSYYDNYSYPERYVYNTADLTKVQAGSNPYPEALPAAPSNMTRGLLTGTRSRVETDTMFLTTSYYYDRKQRPIQVIEENVSGGSTTTNKLYAYDGRLLSTYVKLTNPLSTTTPQITLLTNVHYDANRRVDSVTRKINDDANFQSILSVNSFDELERLKLKRMGVNGAGQLEAQTYTYNVQNWISSINRDAYLNVPGSTAAAFGEEIFYDYGFSSIQFNGNVAGIKWKSGSDGVPRAYGFGYDWANRMVNADFGQQNQGSTLWTNDKVDFSTAGSYDANSNFLSLKQVGMSGLLIKTIDSLKFSYLANSNCLTLTTDYKNDPNSILGDFKSITAPGSKNYMYNAAGGLSKDPNKGIDSFLYNHHGYPAMISLNGKGVIFYQTDGSGHKLTEIIQDTSVAGRSSVRKYMGDFVFHGDGVTGDSLEYIAHAEGRSVPVFNGTQPVGFNDEYFIRDHQNSVRAIEKNKKDTSVYACTNEIAADGAENLIFSNRITTPKPSGYPADNTTSPNDFVTKLNGSTGQKVGPGLVLRVAAGDSLQMVAKAYYTSAAASTSANTSSAMATAILGIFGTGGPVDGIHNGTGAGSPISTFTPVVYDLIKNQDPNQNQSDKPKAYFTFIAYDDQLNLVTANSGTRQVQGSPNALQSLVVTKFVVQKTGFVVCYPTNESAQDVFFDNIIVTHFAGPLQSVMNYYPLGLKMEGISSNAFSKGIYAPNKMGFTGKEIQKQEFQDGTGLELYDMGPRMYDQQIGRFHVQDRLAQKYSALTPYSYAAANPARFTDPSGDSLVVPVEQSLSDLQSLIRQDMVAAVTLSAKTVDPRGLVKSIFLNWGDKTEQQKQEAMQSDPGLRLLNDIITAVDENGNNELYYYSTAESMIEIDPLDGHRYDISMGPHHNADGSVKYNGIDNISVTPRDGKGFVAGEYRPPLGTAGMVRISAEGFFYNSNKDGSVTVWTDRASIVFHELFENFQRSHFKLPYEMYSNGPGAHQNAVKTEGNRYNNIMPGNSKFMPYKAH